MAIDTAAKRKSAISVGLLFLRLGVVPDGTNLSAPQRLHTQGLYAGIAASGTSAQPFDYGAREGQTSRTGTRRLATASDGVRGLVTSRSGKRS